MGNETSQLKGLVIDKKAIEVTDFYSLNLGILPLPASKSTNNTKNASGSNKNAGNNVSQSLQAKEFVAIFQNDDPLQTNFIVQEKNPLTRAIYNMKIYRHPNILKYIAAWQIGTNSFLATENCKPLSALLSGLNDVQICIGLKSILSAIVFLVEHAKARHLNICISSIYVNDEGQWKLFGFEHVWKSSDLSQMIIEKSSTYRYKKAVAKDEVNSGLNGIEQYAFAVLCDDLLKNRTAKQGCSIPHIEEFREYCMKHLKHENVGNRPRLSAILLHPYFNHDFILIHSYLTELPLKSPESKQEFFSTLIDRLRLFDYEEIVASQLSGLLLSRLVLLDTTAKNCFIPYLLKPKSTDDIADDLGLFSQQIFQKYLIPRIKHAFAMKDSQIRIALLEYFPSYVECFSKDELKNEILPELLLGLKDTNDFLVSRTLLCMADLIPILGATQVIGGSPRTKIFSDGRPSADTQIVRFNGSKNLEPRSITPVISSEHLLVSESPLPSMSVDDSAMEPSVVSDKVLLDDSKASQDTENLESDALPEILQERLTPEGEEMEVPSISCQPPSPELTNEPEDWSDWDNPEPETTVEELVEAITKSVIDLKPKPIITTRKVDNIDELDIKNQVFKKIEEPEEYDFFKDMEPVIQKTNVDLFDTPPKSQKPETSPVKSSTRLNMTTDASWEQEDAWGSE